MALSESSWSVTAPTRDSRDSALLDRAFTRAAGAALVTGNSVRPLRDATENYPAWLEAIHNAHERIYFENYFICEDSIGREFAAALASRARAGVRVRLVYDWVGSLGKASRNFWRALSAAGVEVRRFNPLRFANPLDVLHRDHRKMLAVDGRTAFVTGLCVGDMWLGDAARGVAPWRDMGIEVRGPALCDLERAFAGLWATTGEPIPPEELTSCESITETGDVSLRVVANAPGTAGIFRLDQLIAAAARRTLWLTDAYFAGVAPYMQALRAASLDGVDVRLLVPGASDIPLLRPLSQAGFRPLLATGVRVFEWKGPMLHAKTAVADGRWARVGSSNLNVASWIGNYELDVVVENVEFAAGMEQTFLADLENSTELVLEPRRRRIRSVAGGSRGEPGYSSASGRPYGATGAHHRRDTSMSGGGSASRAAAGALRLGRTVSAALTDQRVLAPTEARVVAIVGAVLLIAAVVSVIWPLAVAIPLAVLLAWMATALLIRAHVLRRERRARGLPNTRIGRAEKTAEDKPAAEAPP